MASASPETHFKTLHQLNVDYAPVTITQYESQRTGMRVVVTDQPGPKIHGRFALATEIHDDSAAPHSLEHMCFMGSKSYHYKGLLDKLAARAYGRANAWTDTDWTWYQLDTAGWTGFAQALPVYLEGLLLPLLTDAARYTEVHHVDGSGEDKGVVWGEMQGSENSSSSLMELQAKRLLYPEGNGYRYDTGGLLERLRELKVDRVREFHKAMYKPRNLCLILTGAVDHKELLQILDRFEDTIMSDVPSLDAPFTRPWVESVPTPAIAKTIVKTVEYPDKDESTGSVNVCFFGPKAMDHVETTAVRILLRYLSGSSISKLARPLIEEEKLCSYMSGHRKRRRDLEIILSLGGVKTKNLALAEERVHKLLLEEAKTTLDMDYMLDCIKSSKRSIKQSSEDPMSFFPSHIRTDHVYGNRDGRDLKTLATLKQYDDLEKWTEQQWRAFLSKWFVDAKHISIIGKPSRALAERNDAAHKAYIAARKEKLGVEGLEKLRNTLQEAEEKIAPIPDEELEKFPVPDVASVQFMPTTTARAGKARSMGILENDTQRLIDKDDHDSPLLLHFEDIPSNFVGIRVAMSTASVPVALKPLLSLYLSIFWATPAMRDGKRMEFENVVASLEKDFVSHGGNFLDANAEVLDIGLCVEPEHYDLAISWLRTLFFDAIHDTKRLLTEVDRIINTAPEQKRDGETMVVAACNIMQNTKESRLRACSALTKATFMKRFKKLLETDEDAAIAQYKQMCQALHRPENFRIGVTANVSKLSKPVSAWNALFDGLDLTKPLEPLAGPRDFLSPLGKEPGACVVVPMTGLDSSHAIAVGKCVTDYEHPDLPAINVARAYLSAVEGPLWTAIRGKGLSYGAFIPAVDIVTKGLTFKLIKSPDASKALRAAKEVVQRHASGAQALVWPQVESAKGELVRLEAEAQSCMGDAAAASFVKQVVQGIDKDYAMAMLKKQQAVSGDDIRRVLKQYFVPLFEPGTSNLVITCSRTMEESLVNGLKEMGYEPEVSELNSFKDDYGLPPVEGEDDDEKGGDEKDGEDEAEEGEGDQEDDSKAD